MRLRWDWWGTSGMRAVSLLAIHPMYLPFSRLTAHLARLCMCARATLRKKKRAWRRTYLGFGAFAYLPGLLINCLDNAFQM